MKKKETKKIGTLFEKFSSLANSAAGSPYAFIIAFSFVLICSIVGPFLHFSANWEMVISLGPTIVTFLMVFLIQKSQNKDSLAIQLKLNELVASHKFASNRMVDVENMTEDEMKVIQKYYTKLSDLAEKEGSLQQSHSIDGAQEHHNFKQGIKSKQ